MMSSTDHDDIQKFICEEMEQCETTGETVEWECSHGTDRCGIFVMGCKSLLGSCHGRLGKEKQSYHET